ncbi:AfsR/SARP family transcriptional regulator [Nonomuraea sp. NPDC003754]
MRFGVLGPLTVWDGAGNPVRVPEAKVRALLADLLVHEGRPVSADRLIDDLWGDDLPGNPANALQAKVSQLRRAIGRDRVEHQAAGYRLRLDPGTDEVDADRFGSLVAAARSAGDARARAALLTEALRLWRGPAYADVADEEFARTAAQRLAEQRLAVLEEQAEARLESGEHILLTGELADLVARHPLRERLRAVQLRALYLAGRQSEALASYADLRDRLADELGLDPGPELAALHRAILRQDASLIPEQARDSWLSPARARSALLSPAGGGDDVRASAPSVEASPAPAPDRQPTDAVSPAVAGEARPGSNLPTPLTALIGRERSLDEVGELLGGARLVTLTGPGGVGKTRLAVAAGTRLGSATPDGVWLVELAAQHGGVADVAQLVADVLGVRDDTPPGSGPGADAAPADQPAAPAPDQAAPDQAAAVQPAVIQPAAVQAADRVVYRLAAALRDRRILLVLDNCEHIVEPVAALAHALLGAAPGLRVLATSREPLGLPGEAVFVVEPLPPADAVRLFAERATAADPGFSLGEDTREPVSEICRRLDGIPLALELAATRVRGLGVRELAARLEHRFRLLASGQHGLPARQQTLRAVIDWSWELLSAPERTVLSRLAVHSDGCDLDAAEAVCAGAGVAPEDVVELVLRLVDRSLVVRADGPAGPRYRLLESVAAYARDRLAETDETAEVRDRHLRHYLDLAERAEPRLRDAGQRAWLGRLDAEAANLRAALEEAVRQAAAGEGSSRAVRLATALSWWWLLRGRLGEGHRTLAPVLAVAPDAAELHLAQHAFTLLTGGRPAAPAPDEAAIEDPVRRGRAVWLYAYALFHAGDPAAGEKVNARALDLFAVTGDRWGGAAVLGLRAMHALVGGDLDGVEADGLRSAATFRELGDRWGELQAVTPLSTLAEIRGDYAEAARLQYDGLRIAQELDLAGEVSARHSGLGRLALLSHEWDRAHDLHERARQLAVEQGHLYGEVHALMGLALGARRSGDLDAARSYLVRLRDEYPSSQIGEHLVLAELGFTAELRGDAAEATACHLRGLEIAASLGEPRALALSFEGLAGAAALPTGIPADDAADGVAAGRAALLLGAADAARRSVGAPLPEAERGDVDRITAAATAILGEAAFAAAFQRGATLAPGEAVRVAGAVPSPATPSGAHPG